jgi:WD40 repeat protein
MGHRDAAPPQPGDEPLELRQDLPSVQVPGSIPLTPDCCLARFGNTRLWHPGPVQSLTFSPDGKVLAVTTPDEPVIRFWDVATARLVAEMRVDLKSTTSLTLVGFARDGRRLVVVLHQSQKRDLAQDGWRLAVAYDLSLRGQSQPGDRPPWHEPATIDTESGTVTPWGWGAASEQYLPVFAISPDGEQAAGVTQAGDLKVWAIDTGEEVRKFGRVQNTTVRSLMGVSYSPDGTHVAAYSDERAIYLAPTDGGQPMRRVPVDTAKNGEVYSVFWTQPGRLVARWHNGLVALDPATGRVLARADLDGNTLSRPQLARGDTLFGKDGTNEDVVAIDLATLTKVPGRVFRGSGRGEPFAVSADGKTLALAVGNAVRLFRTETGELLHPDLDHHPSDPAERLHLSADGRRLLTAGGRSAQTWDLPSGQLCAAFDRPPPGFPVPPAIALSPDGRRVTRGESSDGRITVRDAATGAVLFRESGAVGAGSKRSVVGFAGNDRLWVREWQSGELSIVDLPGWQAGPAVPKFPYTSFVTASPDGRRIAAASGLELGIWDADAGAQWVHVESYLDRQGPRCGLSPPPCAIPVRFSPDGRRLLTWDSGFCLWDVTRTPARVGRLFRGWAREWWWPDASFSPDGRRLAGAVSDTNGATSIRVWETASAAELFRCDPPGGATGCAFTPDGKRLVIAHPDTTFSVWDYTALEARATHRAAAAGDVWDRLASPDSMVGQVAVGQLAADPKVAVRLLTERYTPPDPARLARLIADLDSRRFATREAASRELTAQFEWAEPALREAAGRSPSAEVRQRAEAVLRRFELGDGRPTAAYLRAVRAVEVLERLGTAEAAAILKDWAAGGGASVRGTEAKAATARLPAGS